MIAMTSARRSGDRIKALDDVDALRIIAFAARASASGMEAGPDVSFDNRLNEISLAAMGRLFAVGSKSAKEAIADYKRAFPVDGAYGLLFAEWEWEEESKVQAQELKPKE